ncbi:MAG TPA: periplasmic heavy metal sensor [Chitinophagaceae bacterium]|nr:periplasmic heavy metal sensor [Chitinophagaceae bacterium]
MAAPSRNKIYVLLIAILLISNLALVAFFVMNRSEKSKPRDNNPRSFMSTALREEAGFNEDQIKKFQTLADQHKQEIRPLFDELNKSKINFYKMLNQGNVSDSVLRNAADEIGHKQETVDLAIFSHFQSIRQLATPEQQPKLDSLIQKVVKKMISPGRRGGKPDSTRDKRSN